MVLDADLPPSAWGVFASALGLVFGACASTKPLQLYVDDRVRVELHDNGTLQVDERNVATVRPDGVVSSTDGAEISRVVDGGLQFGPGSPIAITRQDSGATMLGPTDNGSMFRFMIFDDGTAILPTKRPPGDLRFKNLTDDRYPIAMLILVLIHADECELWPEAMRDDCSPLLLRMEPLDGT